MAFSENGRLAETAASGTMNHQAWASPRIHAFTQISLSHPMGL